MFFRRIVDEGAHRPVAILVHGLVISSAYMEPLMHALAPWCDVYAPDLPGFGHSPLEGKPLSLVELAQALDAFMGRQGLDRAVIAGNSFGAQIASELAVVQPARVAGLVMLGPTVDDRRRTLPKQVWRWALNGLQESPWLAMILARDFLLAGVGVFSATLREMMGDAPEQRMRQIRQPVLVVRGERDPLVSHAWIEEIARLCGGSVVEVKGGTHAVNYSRPQRTAEIMRAFVDGVMA